MIHGLFHYERWLFHRQQPQGNCAVVLGMLVVTIEGNLLDLSTHFLYVKFILMAIFTIVFSVAGAVSVAADVAVAVAVAVAVSVAVDVVEGKAAAAKASQLCLSSFSQSLSQEV